MKVKDILAELKGADPETDITFHLAEGCCDEYVQLEGAEVDLFTYPVNEERITFSFKPLMGHESCIRVGAINKFIGLAPIRSKLLETLFKLGLRGF